MMGYVFAAAIAASVTLQDVIPYGYLVVMLIVLAGVWIASTLPSSIRAQRKA